MRRTFFFGVALLYTSLSCEATEGMHLYLKHCAACHGQNGERKAWNVTDPIAGWPAEAVKKALVAYKEHSRDQYGYGDYMHPQISKYSDKEIDKIARYIATLHNENTVLAAKRR